MTLLDKKVLHSTIDALEVQSEEKIVRHFPKSFSKTSLLGDSGNIQKITLRLVLKIKLIFLDYF